jgi:uncharacterized repeat protein (TIGR01451 family)
MHAARPVFAVALSAIAVSRAHAVGTIAGTAVANQAEIVYEIGSEIRSQTSNISSFQVAEVLDVSVLLQTPERLVAPGARIVYTILVSADGTGSAETALFEDAIPPHTSYVPGSLELNGMPLTDASDADVGEVSGLDPSVVVDLGSLGADSVPQQVQFTVTID